MFAIGASLREARVKRDLAPGDVQKALRIRERYLQALEEEQWQLLPGDAYTKGFLRSYADFLGLDGNLYVDEYVARFRAFDERPLALQSLAHGGRERRRVGLLRPLIAIAVLAAIVAVVVWQLERPSGTPSPTKTHHHTQKRNR